ncbi:MAG TPA: hypothetical protein VMU53_13270 [Candidatus Sulfotelmatobacter sp.]|nr:hypothetical protein [Candidatus Sulfotelmatobacter sp.]
MTPLRAGLSISKIIASITSLLLFATWPVSAQQQSTTNAASTSLQLSRSVRAREFLPAVGQRAAFFGDETGRMEAWVYPLKLFRDFHLLFHTADGQTLPADALARSIDVRPESASVLYAGDDFTVRETFFVPVQESGAVVLLDVDTEQPLDIEVCFQADFQLEWPAAIGGSDMEVSADGRSFLFAEESKHVAAIVGSPTAVNILPDYETNYSESRQSSFHLGVTAKGKDTKIVALAGSTLGLDDAIKTYRKLLSSWADLRQQSAQYYRDYLARTVSLDLPDSQLQQAYDWARVSVLQGLVDNPKLGSGLIAGYRTSGYDYRPGFAWFFGRDTFWTSLALTAEGDTSLSRTAISFISNFQRADGKIPHEISQSAGYVDWLKDYPYAYASADATPLYLIAADDYFRHTGDAAFIKEKWDSLWKAYQFLRSTWDEHQFPKNEGIGHGWVEGGPLVPVKTELYQTALGAEAIHALADLAHAIGQQKDAVELDQLFAQQKSNMNGTFWLPGENHFAFALDHANRPVDELSVLSTVPMWFGLLDNNKAEQTITQLAAPEHQTDWGMRIISINSPKFNGGGYHFGSVWPLFTGWAAVGEYRYHRAQPAYANLRSNALLVFDGSLGHVTEVLSGAEYQQLATSSPQQIWSAAMVISPILRGLLGLDPDAVAHTLTLAPHVPANWTTFAIHNVAVGPASLDLRFQKTTTDITLDVTPSGGSGTILNFEPAVSLRAKVLAVELNGHPAEFHVQPNDIDQHILVHVPLHARTNTIRIRLKNDFAVSYNSNLPVLGEDSSALRILSETWSPQRDALTVDLSGKPGATYDLALWNALQIRSIDGASLLTPSNSNAIARVQFPASASTSYTHAAVIFHF